MAIHLYRCLAWVCRTTPLFIAKPILCFLSLLYFSVDFKKRPNVIKNLKALLGEKYSLRVCFRTYLEFGYFLFEFFSGKPSKTTNHEELMSHLQQHLGKVGSSSSILLMGHYGNWEVALQQLLATQYPVTTLSMKHSSPEVDEFFNRQRHHPGLECADIGQGLKPLFHALTQNRQVALACERDYKKSGLILEHNQHSHRFPIGPAVLALRSNAPVYIFYQERVDLFTFRSELHPFPYSKEESVETFSKRLAKELFSLIERNPSQWLTFDPYFFKGAAS